jgi:hypothetical protein
MLDQYSASQYQPDEREPVSGALKGLGDCCGAKDWRPHLD